MTYCCNHAKRANELMDSAITWISGTSSHETEPMLGVFALGGVVGFENKKACEEYKEWMSNARNKINEAKQELSQCKCIQIMPISSFFPTNFSVTVTSSSSSTAETARFLSTTVSEVAARRGGQAVATIQNDATVNVRYNPPMWWMG